jgi:glutamate-1-semialdehyde aminotransferase
VIPESPGLAEGAWRDTIVLPFNHPAAFDKLRRYADRLAGVIIEPVQGAAGTIPAKREFLAELRTITREIGAFLIFDEVDSGIGGAMAEVVGKKLRELSQHHQVICVTHLP